MVLLALVAVLLQDSKEAKDLLKERSSFLRAAKKGYATLVAVDPAKGEVVLRSEGDSQERTWPVDRDAEVRVQGYWGALEDLAKGERVWTWTRVDRDGKPRAIFMIADEISEEDIHQVPYKLVSVDREKQEVVVRRALDGRTEEARTLAVGTSLASLVPEGNELYVQTAGGEILRAADAATLRSMKKAQKEKLEARWRKEGLPGTLGSLHALVGEVELVLDHEAFRWGRALRPNDPVTINLRKPIKAQVLEIHPWNERTRVSLAVVGRDLADVRPGDRVRLLVPEPPAEILASPFPPDAGRAREGSQRLEWFLASTYCACSIAGDV